MTSIVASAEAGAAINSGIQAAGGPGLRRGDALEHAAKQFEAVFLRQMIASMREPSLGEDMLSSDAANQFRDMSDARLADAMSGQFGIAKLLETQFGGKP